MPMQPTQLLSPLTDIVFKALFAREEPQSKIILVDLLNALLDLYDSNKITTITHLNPFNYQEFQGDKSSILDIKVKTQTRQRINIEVQINDVDNFRKRSLYYWAKMYAGTIAATETYTSLKKSIVINILDFDLISETDKYHTQYGIMEKNQGFTLIQDLEIHYFELQKLIGQVPLEKMTPAEKWLTFMKSAGKPGHDALLNELIAQKEELAMAMDMLEEVSADEIMRERALAREKFRRDNISRIKYAELKGVEKGIKLGEGKGKAELLIKQLSKRFGHLPVNWQNSIREADEATLDSIGDAIFDLENMDDLLKFIG